jgi:2-amino-4-hydroxy-6-hydroxymethyldihydropteridine diphosphokinase
LKKVYIGLGSNLGDRLKNLRTALERISSLPKTKLLGTSSTYETPPWGHENQPEFLNLVCVVETSLAPLALLTKLKGIEKGMGRTRSFRYAPRPIDLDILLWGEEVITSSELTVPHPQLHLREFVLRPLTELDPDLIHPTLKRRVGELLEMLEGSRCAPPKSVSEGSHE